MRPVCVVAIGDAIGVITVVAAVSIIAVNVIVNNRRGFRLFRVVAVVVVIIRREAAAAIAILILNDSDF